MSWFDVPTEEPSIIFPVGAVIEDATAIYKILAFEKQDKFLHKYKVEVLTQKLPIPDSVKSHIDPNNRWLIVLPQNLGGIQRLQ